MDKRTRSPAYPAISLPDAVDKLSTLFDALQTHAAPRDVIARGMGYTGLNGASASAIAALGKYGLLERYGGDELRISERAMSILHPHDPSERGAAIDAAALEPKLFAELRERFPGKMPNEELLRNYLVRNGYAASAVRSVVLSYRQTLAFVEAECGPVAPEDSKREERRPTAEYARSNGLTSARAADPRMLGRYDFEDGSCVQITASGSVSTKEALDMVETLVRIKREELGRRNKLDTGISKEPYSTAEIGVRDARRHTEAPGEGHAPDLLGYVGEQ